VKTKEGKKSQRGQKKFTIISIVLKKSVAEYIKGNKTRGNN